MSATRDSALANAEQRIANLERQLGEAREQQTATAEIVEVISSSPGDLKAVFDAMLERAVRLCEAAHAYLYTYDSERFSPVAMRGDATFADWLRQQAPIVGMATSPHGRIAQGERFVHIADVLQDDAYRNQVGYFHEACDRAGTRTFLAVSLRKDDALLGTIHVYRREVRPFSEKQIALLQNFAAQAVIAMENARLITETREALEQQTATAEVLGVINSSPGDLTPVFDAILEKAHGLCDVTRGSLQLYDGEKFRAVAMHNLPQALADRLREGYTPNNTPSWPLLEGVPFAHIADIAARADTWSRDGGTRLFVALRKDGQLLGQIVAARQEVRPFTDKQIALLQSFAAQAVIAMENARLMTETREALEQQTATAEVLQVINASPGELKPVFEAMLEKAVNLCGASFGLLMRYDGDALHTVAHHNSPPKFVEFLAAPVHPAPGMASYRILRGEDAVTFGDIAADTSYSAESDAAGQLVELSGARSHLTVALRKDDVLLGVIVIYRQEVLPFTDKEIALVKNFAAQAVIAIENARLITETREALEQQTATAEVLQVINASPGDLQPVFDAILKKAHTLCGADAGSFAINNGGERLPAVATRGYADEHAVHARHGLLITEPGIERLASGETIHIPDISLRDPHTDMPLLGSGDEIARAIAKTAIELTGIRAYLAVPLRKDGRLLGYLSAQRKHVRPFSDREVALLQNFAAQAVIAMENARLITETREALEQQTATAEVLGVINSSPGDLAPVFDAMLEKAMRLCEANFGFLSTYEGQRFTAIARHGLPDTYVEEYLTGPYLPGPNTTHDRLVRGELVVHVPNLAVDSADSPRRRAVVEVLGVRSILAVPLLKDRTLVGAIHVYRKEVRPFTDKQIALLQNFAAQSVIAMENARLITETREALDQQTATAEVLGVINSSPGDLTPVFDAMLDKAMRLCGAAFGMMGIRDGDKSRTVATRGVPDTLAEFRRQNPAPPTSPIWSRVLKGEPVIHTVDLKQEQAYESGDPQRRALVDLGGARTSLAVTLMKDRAVLGAINVYRQEVHPFSDKQIALLQNFAAQAVIAIENARLLDELRQRTDQVAELNRGLEARVAEQVEELGRVGRLKRFLAPQLAELIVSHGDEKILESHRREIVVVFCDLRGYTAFTETAEPEEVLDFLREYHGALGPLVSQFEGTLDQFSGDGIMVFFNDPVPIPDPAERAVKMAMAMRKAAGDLIAAWRRRGRELGFGAGIAQGYATLGQIGFAERSGYTAIGTVCNIAARLCAEARDGQILLSQRVAVAVEGTTTLEEIGALTLKGLTQPVVAYNVPLATTQPALSVIEGGPESV